VSYKKQELLALCKCLWSPWVSVVFGGVSVAHFSRFSVLRLMVCLSLFCVLWQMLPSSRDDCPCLMGPCVFHNVSGDQKKAKYFID